MPPTEVVLVGAKRGRAPPDPMYVSSFVIRKSQGARLRQIAEERALAEGYTKPDMSKLVREAIEAWLAQHKGRGKARA